MIALLMLPALAGCATTGASVEQRDAAGQAEVDCFTSRAHVLDDNASDAATIGRAVASACASYTDAHIGMMPVAGSPGVEAQLVAQMRRDATERATQIVLLVRRHYR